MSQPHFCPSALAGPALARRGSVRGDQYESEHLRVKLHMCDYKLLAYHFRSATEPSIYFFLKLWVYVG